MLLCMHFLICTYIKSEGLKIRRLDDAFNVLAPDTEYHRKASIDGLINCLETTWV